MIKKQLTPRCKNCKERFIQRRFNLKYCDKDECMRVFADKVKTESWKKEKVKRKKDLMTVQDWIKIAQTHFNTFVRFRDLGNDCISCGKKPLKKNAGHYHNANNHWAVRFDEDNVHLQCEHCNTHLSGNLIPYRDNLIKKIGYEGLERLNLKANMTRKFTVEELKEIAENYKKKVKEMK